MNQVDRTLRTSSQRARIQGQLDLLRVAWAAQSGQQGQLTEARHLDQVLQRAVGRFLYFEGGIHALRIELNLDRVVAIAARALSGDLCGHLLQ